MRIWSVQEFGGRFHNPPEEAVSIDDDAVEAPGPVAGDPMVLPAPRRQAMENFHRLLRRSWIGGGAFCQLYSLDRSEGDTTPAPETVISLFWDLADADALPADIAGCSIAWLAEGRVWPETPQQFGDALYKALSEGGVAGEGLSPDEAEEQVSEYLEALFDPAEEDDLYFFGLDPGFSCWFCDGEYDIAYVILNTEEDWLALFMATDQE